MTPQIPRLELRDLATRHVGPISLQVQPGEIITLSGASGSGKTLLLRAVADLDPHSGEVFLDGIACTGMPAHLWRQQVALLPAESQWWLPTVGEHFRAPESAPLETLGFTPQSLGWNVERLSSGEKQRLSFLRTLCQSPKVLLLDEPTANLDERNGRRLEKFILDYQQQTGVAILWVTHNAEQAQRISRRHYWLQDGRLQESTLQEVMP